MEVCWNLTNCCPFYCKICMVCSIKVNRDNKTAMQSRLRKTGKCLSFADKVKVIKDIASSSDGIKIDFAGGDPLLFKENLEIIKIASGLFGKENIEISTTGYCIDCGLLTFLKRNVAKLDFTLDTVFPRLESSREERYCRINIDAIRSAVESGVPVTVSTVLKKDNIDKDNLCKMYEFLIENKVSNWFLLRYRALGRGHNYKQLAPTEQEYKEALEYCLSLEQKEGPKINIHHTFYDLMGVTNKNKACKIGNKFTILSDGTVLSCCWAFDQEGKPLNDLFVLGRVPQDKFKNILNSSKLGDIKRVPACRVEYFTRA